MKYSGHYGQNTSTVTYLWSNGATTEDLTGVAAGTYSVTATDCNGCIASTTVDVGLLGLSEEGLNAIFIHPNPASDMLYFSATANKVEVFDFQGRLVETTMNTDNIDVKYLASGAYSIRLTIKDAFSIHRFVKE